MNNRSKVRRTEYSLPQRLNRLVCLIRSSKHLDEKADLRLFVAEELTSGRHKRLLQRAN